VTKEIALKGRGGITAVTIVDDEDYERFGSLRWYVNDDGYAQRSAVVSGKHKTYRLNREIMGLAIGDPRIADHVDELEAARVVSEWRAEHMPYSEDARTQHKGHQDEWTPR
jgi:hypothetical protein